MVWKGLGCKYNQILLELTPSIKKWESVVDLAWLPPGAASSSDELGNLPKVCEIAGQL